MKTISRFSFTFVLLLSTLFTFAQTKKETFKVLGECGMCKKKIESAARNAGASFASWDVEAKTLTVKYDSKSVTAARIQEAVAAAGYDNVGAKATDEAYDKLHSCCKYARSAEAGADSPCCDSDKCKEKACMKDGKCSPDMSCCKDSGCSSKGCCKKDGALAHTGAAHNCKTSEKAASCSDDQGKVKGKKGGCCAGH